MEEIKKAFEKTTELLFGRALSSIEDYESWLTKGIPKGDTSAPIAGKKIYVPRYGFFKYIPKHRVAGLDSLNELSNKKIPIQSEMKIIDISKNLGDIAIYITEFAEGENRDVVESSIYMNLYHAYKIVDCFNSRNIAYSFFTDYCDYVFGVYRTFNSKLSMRCYNSTDISLGFELDFCKSCSNIMFSHNCENVHDSMFCFNIKNKRYAIANVELGKEKFQEIRGIVCDYILMQLEEKKCLDLTVFNVGCSTTNCRSE